MTLLYALIDVFFISAGVFALWVITDTVGEMFK